MRAAGDCRSIPGVRLEFWMASPGGEYDDAHRATVFAGPDGEYRFESTAPVPYSGRPPHIHVKATAPGYRTLVMQHYPDAGQTETTFDVVLAPE